MSFASDLFVILLMGGPFLFSLVLLLSRIQRLTEINKRIFVGMLTFICIYCGTKFIGWMLSPLSRLDAELYIEYFSGVRGGLKAVNPLNRLAVLGPAEGLYIPPLCYFMSLFARPKSKGTSKTWITSIFVAAVVVTISSLTWKIFMDRAEADYRNKIDAMSSENEP